MLIRYRVSVLPCRGFDRGKQDMSNGGDWGRSGDQGEYSINEVLRSDLDIDPRRLSPRVRFEANDSSENPYLRLLMTFVLHDYPGSMNIRKGYSPLS